jgi:hypothetical protein
MADLVRQVSDKFPVGTTVGAYPGTAAAGDRPPAADAVDTAVVAANGTLTLDGLADNTTYVLAATVDSQHRAIVVKHNQAHTAGVTWQTTVANRRTAMGTS